MGRNRRSFLSMKAIKNKISLRERLAQNLQELRTSRQVSQEELARLAGFHRTYVSQLERGVTNISLDNLEKIAGALEVDAVELLQAR